MTDPWDLAAQDLTRQRQQQAGEEAAATRQCQIEQAKQRAEAEAAHQEIQAAIAAAVPQLTAFLEKRGAAAQRLLAACGERAHIMFGSKKEGAGYVSVFLHSSGLCREIGVGRQPQDNRFATPQEAVHAFAYHGQGRQNPQRVRDIVAWLTQSIEAYVR